MKNRMTRTRSTRVIGEILYAMCCLAQLLPRGVQANEEVPEIIQEIEREADPEPRREYALLGDLQWTKVPVSESGVTIDSDPDRWWLEHSCHDHCQECTGYGHCTKCKEGYVSSRTGTALTCGCIDSHCFSCPEDPGVCTTCADDYAEPNEIGLCVCMTGYVYDQEAGVCARQGDLMDPLPSLEPGVETLPTSPEPIGPAIPEIPEIAVPSPENTLEEESPEFVLDPLDPAIVGDPLCRDVLCSVCTGQTDGCDVCVVNASKDANGVCACDAGYTEMVSISGSGCLLSKENGGEGADGNLDGNLDDNIDVGVRPLPPATSSNGLADGELSVRPLVGVGFAGSAGSVGSAGPDDVTITPIVEEKIRELADKYGIVLGDKFENLVAAKDVVSEAVADKAAAVADAMSTVGAAAANAHSGSKKNPVARDGFQYRNIRLESYIPEEDASNPDLSGDILSRQSALDDGSASSTSSGLRGWLRDRLGRDEEEASTLDNVPHSGPPLATYVSGQQEGSSYVSGFDGAPQAPASYSPSMLTPEESYRKDLMDKKAMLMDLLKETDETMRKQIGQRAQGADERTQVLLDMLKSTDDELERRIS